MFKKTLTFTLLATALFAAPVSQPFSLGFDIPIPPCFPCGPGDLPGQPALQANLDIPIPPCFPCGPGDLPGQPA